VLIIAVLALAQMPEKPQGTAQDSARDAYFRELRQRQEDTTSAITGWLILDGKLIPGPYVIDIKDDWLEINGRPYMAPKPPEPKREVPQNIKDQHRAVSGILNTFHEAVPLVGVDSAHALALSYALSQSVIDTAYYTASDRLEYLPHGESWPGFIWLRPILESPQPYEEIRKDRLQHRALQLKNTLNGGCLIFTDRTGGMFLSITPPEAEEIVRELQRIVTTIPDMQERISAVKEIVVHGDLAEAIAKNLK